MKKINLITLMLAVFTISVNAQFKVGLDYRIVANPLPVKKDGVVEVVESFGMDVEVVIRLSQQ